MAVSYVSVSTLADYDGITAGAANMPAGYAVGDILICITVARGLTGLTSTWATGIASVLTTGFIDLVSYQIATSTSETAPTITPAGGVNTKVHMSRVIALSGVDPVTPFGDDGGFVQNVSQADIGPVPAATAINQGGAVFVYGCRLSATWTVVATLTGDGLTWTEIFQDASTIGNDMNAVCDYALWTTSVPTLTDKTFTVTTGASFGAGRMFVLNATPTGQPTRKRLGGTKYASRNLGVW